MYQKPKPCSNAKALSSASRLYSCWPYGLPCKPTPQFEVLQHLTDQKWQVEQVEIYYDYEFEEKYTVASSGNFRLVKQKGEFSITYYASPKTWRITGDYQRDEESAAGPIGSNTVRFDTTHRGLVGLWEFRTDASNVPTGLSQRYYNELQDCDEFASHTGNWQLVTQETEEGLYIDPLIDFDFAHLYSGPVAGGLVFSPHIYDGMDFLNGLAKIRYNEFLQRLEIEYDYSVELPLRDTSFTSPNYGEVEIKEKDRSIVMWISLKKVDDIPCEATTGCAPGSIPCVNGDGDHRH